MWDLQCATRCRLNEYNYVENIKIQSIECPILDESCFCEIEDKPLGVKMGLSGRLYPTQ